MTHFDESRVLSLARVLTEFARGCSGVSRTTRHMSEYEHVMEARTALMLLNGHAVALNALAELGAATYPSGWPVARSMFEVGVRTAWRMDVDDPHEAEGRWVTWLTRFVEYERTRGDSLEAEGAKNLAQNARSRADQTESFRIDLVKMLNLKNVVPATKEPSMKQILKALGQPPHRYQIYADASEQLHGSFVAVEAYSQDLGTARAVGEFASWIDWVAPLRTGFIGVQALSHVFADRVESDRMEQVIETAEDAWEEVLRS